MSHALNQVLGHLMSHIMSHMTTVTWHDSCDESHDESRDESLDESNNKSLDESHDDSRAESHIWVAWITRAVTPERFTWGSFGYRLWQSGTRSASRKSLQHSLSPQSLDTLILAHKRCNQRNQLHQVQLKTTEIWNGRFIGTNVRWE